ncbi:hypothetical protein GW17_00058492 [Ensete ventricosum]|nr:hypothetical protein GW17_00058492 [Ensete ventricosum]
MSNPKAQTTRSYLLPCKERIILRERWKREGKAFAFSSLLHRILAYLLLLNRIHQRETARESNIAIKGLERHGEELGLGFYGGAVGVGWIHRRERRRAHDKEVVSQACNLSVEMTKPTKEPERNGTERLGSHVADELSQQAI